MHPLTRELLLRRAVEHRFEAPGARHSQSSPRLDDEQRSWEGRPQLRRVEALA